jgi:hypothetical protein
MHRFANAVQNLNCMADKVGDAIRSRREKNYKVIRALCVRHQSKKRLPPKSVLPQPALQAAQSTK